MTEPVFGLSFAGGINQADQGEIVDAASAFTMLSNTRQPHRGAAQKRNGYGSLGKTRLEGSDRSEGRRLLTNGEQLCTIDGSRIDVYVPSLSCFVPRSQVPEADFTYFSVPAIGTDIYVADVAYVNGFIVVAEVVSVTGSFARKCYVSVLDAATEAIVRGPELVASSSVNAEFVLASYGARCVLGFSSSALGQVHLYTLNTTDTSTLAAGWVHSSAITATGNIGLLVMAQCPTLGDRIAVAYAVSSGTDRLVVFTVGAAGVIETVTVDTSSTTPDDFDMSEHGETLWVAWSVGGVARLMALDPSDVDGTPLGTVVSLFSMLSMDIITVVSAGPSTCLVSGYGGSDQPYTVRRATIAAGAVTNDSPSVAQYYNARPRGRPFWRDGKAYAWFGSNGRDDLTLCEFTQPSGGHSTLPIFLRPVVSPIVRGLIPLFFFARCRTAAIDAARYAFVFPTKRTGLSDGVASVELDFASSDRWSHAEYHSSTHIGGGVTTVFDGSYIVESNFLCAPTIPSVDVSSAGSMSFTLGGRRYVAVYASADADGNLSVSGVSPPTDATGNITSKQIIVGIDPLSITMRGVRSASVLTEVAPVVQIFLYATGDGGEEPYHFLKSVANDPQSSLLTIEDDVDETTLASGALLYGSGNLPGTFQDGQPGGPQDHRSPPGLRCLTPYNGMLCGIVGSEVWFCSQPVYGEASWWSPLFTAQFDDEPTALFVQDGALYATTRDTVYSLSGDPPNDAGTNGGLSLPRKLAVERGCINARSVCVTSGGTFYQSSRGYELFRSGGLTPVGDLVQDTLAEFPNVTSAVFDAKRGLVRISLAKTIQATGLVAPFEAAELEGDPDFGGGRDLIFDVIMGAWVSVDSKYGSSEQQPSQDAIVASLDGEPTYVWLATDGTVYSEASDYLDMAEWVTMSAETGWIHIAGMQGEQFLDRILLLAKMVTAHDLTIEIAYDFKDTYTTTRAFTSTQITALVRQWLDAEILQTTNQAVRVRITDATPSGDGDVDTGEGGKWIDLTFNGQPHRGPKRTAGAQRSG